MVQDPVLSQDLRILVLILNQSQNQNRNQVLGQNQENRKENQSQALHHHHDQGQNPQVLLEKEDMEGNIINQDIKAIVMVVIIVATKITINQQRKEGQ